MKTIKAVVQRATIRGCEEMTNKAGGKYLLVHYDTETDFNGSELVDKDMERAPYYKRGAVMDLYIEITIGKYTNIRIIDAREIKEEG